jgi:hypothetical protein
MNKLIEDSPATPGWTYKQTHWDCFVVRGPNDAKEKSFKNYLYMCWWCGSNGINPTEAV